VADLDGPGSVGVVGIGRIGVGIAISLARVGFQVGFVVHRSRDRTHLLQGAGCREEPDLRSLIGHSDVLLLCLPSAVEVANVLTEVEDCRGPRMGLIIDTTTSAPAETRRWAGRLAELGIILCDAPVTRGPKEAMNGRLNTLFGGGDAAWSLARPVITAYSENIIRTGPVGSGHQLKLLNNMLSIGQVCLAVEVFRAARDHGVDVVQLRDVSHLGGGRSAAFEALVDFAGGDGTVLDFAISTALKDLDYAVETFGMQSWANVVPAAQMILRGAQRRGLADRNLPFLAD
jgi:3-hydroxyisobutyrate dehydrogenase